MGESESVREKRVRSGVASGQGLGWRSESNDLVYFNDYCTAFLLFNWPYCNCCTVIRITNCRKVPRNKERKVMITVLFVYGFTLPSLPLAFYSPFTLASRAYGFIYNYARGSAKLVYIYI